MQKKDVIRLSNKRYSLKLILGSLFVFTFLFFTTALTQTTFAQLDRLGESITDADSASKKTLNEIDEIIKKPQLQIRIPGLSFSDKDTINKLTRDDETGTFLIFPWLGQYISGIYRFSIAASAIVAVVVIIIAGFIWTLSAGNAGTISVAKQRIVQAVIGFILILSSYTILYTINPALVNFQSLAVRVVERDDLYEGYDEPNIDEGLPVGGSDILAIGGGKIADSLTSPGQVTWRSFHHDESDGRKIYDDLWATLTTAQQQEIISDLYIVPAENFCPGVDSLPVLGKDIEKISGFKGKIHPVMHPVLKEAQRQFNIRGFRIGGSIFRTTARQAEKWNAGLVRRYIEKGFNLDEALKEHKANLGRPACGGGHQGGAATDIKLYDERPDSPTNGDKLIKVGNAYSKSNYEKVMFEGANSKYYVFLEKIMHEVGFVRYCAEYWHFEYGISARYNSWDKQSRCWQKKDSWDMDPPADIKTAVDALYDARY